MTGIVLAQLALTVLVYARTHSPLLAALVFATAFLPQLIAGTLLSALVDRVPARRLLVGCNVVSALMAAAMTIPGTPVLVLLVLAFALGLIRPVFLSARAATLKDVLTDGAFVAGRSLIRLVNQASQVAGFAVSGVLLTVLAPQVVLLGNAGCFLVAAVLLYFGTAERVPLSTKSAKMSLIADSLSGLADVWSVAPVRRLLLLSWTVPALAVTPEALAVPYAAGLSGGTVAVGLLLTGLPVGTLVGETACIWWVPAEAQAKVIAPSTVLIFAPLLCFAVHPPIPLAVLILFVSGLGSACYLGLDRVVLEVAPEPLLARTLSIQATGIMFWQGIGYAIAGSAASAISPVVVIPAAGICGLIALGGYALAARLPQRPRPAGRPVTQLASPGSQGSPGSSASPTGSQSTQ